MHNLKQQKSVKLSSVLAVLKESHKNGDSLTLGCHAPVLILFGKGSHLKN